MKDAAVTPGAGASPRPLAEILLEHGFVSQEQLDQAAEAQERSGKPLGQVLVEAGALTRLELASALAEQWSSTDSWLGPPRDTPGDEQQATPAEPGTPLLRTAAAPAADGKLEGRLHALEAAVQALRDRENTDVLRLQESSLELSRRLAALEPALEEAERRAQETVTAAELDERLGPLGPRLDGFGAALAVGEARLDQLANAFDAAVARQDEANVAVTQALDALSGRVEATTAALAAIEERLAEVGARPAGDPGLAARLEELAGRVATLADAADLAQVRAEVTSLAARPAPDTSLVDALAARVEELAARPAGDPELARRVEELAARPAGDPGLEQAVAALSERVAGLADIEALADLRTTLDELAARPASDAELAAQLAQLAARVDALPQASALDELRAAVDALAARPAGDPALGERIDRLEAALAALPGGEELGDLRRALDELAARPPSDPQLAHRHAELAARVDGLAARSDGHADAAALEAVRRETAELAARLDAVAAADELTALRGAVDELAARPAGDPELAARVAELAARLEAGPAADPRVDELEARVRAVEERPAGEARDTEPLERRLAELDASVARLASDLEEAASAHEALARRPDRAPAPAAAAGGAAEAPAGDLGALDQEVERLRMAIERMGLRLGEHDRALVELMQSTARQAVAPAPALPAAAPGRELSPEEAGDVDVQLQALAARLAQLEEASRTDREKAFKEIERVASSLVWRLQRLETRESQPA